MMLYKGIHLFNYSILKIFKSSKSFDKNAFFTVLYGYQIVVKYYLQFYGTAILQYISGNDLQNMDINNYQATFIDQHSFLPLLSFFFKLPFLKDSIMSRQFFFKLSQNYIEILK